MPSHERYEGERRGRGGEGRHHDSPTPSPQYSVHTVHFSVVYRLHRPALSATKQFLLLGNSAAHLPLPPASRERGLRPSEPTAATVPSAPLPSLQRVMWREALGRKGRASLGDSPSSLNYAAHDSSSNFLHTHRDVDRSNDAGSSTLLSSHPARTTTLAVATAGAAQQGMEVHRSGCGSDAVTDSVVMDTSLPLSTFDLRELSKVVLRDALFAQLLDLVPSRASIRCAVWQLGPQHLQLDAAVGVPTPFEWAGSRQGERVFVERVSAVAYDAGFFAGVLRPYLGEEGSAGMLESVRVNVTGAYV